jgi:hypothetical protein
VTNTPIEQRFWSKVDLSGACWIWLATKAGSGYGQFSVSGSGSTRVRVYAHRWAYEDANGPIPEGMELDHLCRRRDCVRPQHLQPVTHSENHRRRRGIKTGPYNVGTHCKHGHERTPENTGVNVNGARFCRPCAREVTRIARERRLKRIAV